MVSGIVLLRKRVRFEAGIGAVLVAGGCYVGPPDQAGGSDDPTAATAAAESGGTSSGGSDDGSDDGVTEGIECDGEIVDPGPNLVRRLTRGEYVNTIQSTLGVDVEAEAVERLPAELRADGFTNTASGLIVTLEHIEAYEALAEIAVSRVPDLAGLVAAHTDCLEFDAACENAFVASMGSALFRRPLTADEHDALVPRFAAAQAEGEDFVTGAGLVLEVMLQSPPFLYRLEDETQGPGEIRVVDGYEMATRLSYLVWSGPPDDVLLAAAAGDGLATAEELEAQVDRMLADPRARAASKGFIRDWLHLSRLEHLPRDPARFPDWNATVSGSMQQETLAFFESVAWDQERPLLDLFDAQETWLTPELATYYGLEPEAGDGVAEYDVGNVAERGGLLTQGSVLTVGGDDASMVSRGLFVLDTILCGHLDSPPAQVDTTVPPVEPGKSQRLYSEERTSNPSCLGCHRQMEPLAWGLERFLADGSYAAEDEHGNALLESGYVRFPGDPAEHDFESVAGMMEILAGSDQVEGCLGEKAMQFTIARPLTDEDSCAIDQLKTRLSESAGTYRDLVMAVAMSPEFRTMRVEEGQ